MKKQEWSRSRRFNKHHIVNKCKGGKKTKSNLLTFEVNRHKAWHFLFGNKSFEEVEELLRRCRTLKELQQESLAEL